MVGTVELETLGFCGSVVVIGGGIEGWAGSGTGGTGFEGVGSAVGIVVGMGTVTPGGGGCEEEPGAMLLDAGSFF